MKSKENLVFLGMMGSGKSSIGLLVAKKLKLNFIDIDNEIEKKLGISISKIFEYKGESFFRKVEEQVTLKKLKIHSSVISLGGGAFMNENIRKEILKSHLSFWLYWNNNILLGRIKNSNKRPLAVNSSDDQIIDLIEERSRFYTKALFKIKCDNLTKNEVVNKIIKIYESN
jgi:shikimate kinase/shikimate kinase/3-dehydroquinate synthase